MIYKINVTKDHIEMGEPLTCCGCPVALAISNVTKFIVEVQTKNVRILKEVYSKPVRINLPEIATDFIIDFDLGMVVTPIAFDLDIP